MTNAEARFNKSLRPQKPEGSLGRTAQDVHLDSHTAPNYTAVDIDRLGRIGTMSIIYDFYSLPDLNITPEQNIYSASTGNYLLVFLYTST